MACPVCERRKPKRYCPAKHAKICSLCCGTQREVTIECPFECSYLQEARDSECQGIVPEQFPYKEIEIDSDFVRRHGPLLEACGQAALVGALNVAGAVDTDVRDALKALIETQKTLESGIYYETKPESAYARQIAATVRDAIEEFRGEETKGGFTATRERDVLLVLVFLYRMALDRDNGRAKGRSFLHFLALHFPVREEAVSESGIIVPGR